MTNFTQSDDAFDGPLENPYWILKDYGCANIPCAIFDASFIKGNPFESFDLRCPRHETIDNIAVLPKYLDAIEPLLEDGARGRFKSGGAVRITLNGAHLDLDGVHLDRDEYCEDWAERLVRDKHAVLLDQTRDWFYEDADQESKTLRESVMTMAREHKIVAPLMEQLSLIQSDHKARLLRLSPAPLKYLPGLRLASKTVDYLIFHPPTPGDAA